jgi:tetratricopeptide (TPR) repeat protein
MAFNSTIVCRSPFPRRASSVSIAVAAAIAAAVLMAAPPANAQPVPAQSAGRSVEMPAATAVGEGISADLFYKFMLAEVALQRGDGPLAAKAYYEAARESRDPRVARRATEIALAARQRTLAVDAATLWTTLEPDAPRPKQILASLTGNTTAKDLSDSGVDDEIRGRLEKLLSEAAISGEGVGETFLQINRFFAQQPERKQVYEIILSLAKPYPASAEAHFAIAYAAYGAEIPASQGVDPALAEVNRALDLKPGWERAALLKADIFARTSPESAVTYLKTFVADNPDAKSAAGALAQVYVEQKKYAEARAIFQKLWDGDRTAREFEFGVAAISMQMKDWTTAEALFTDLQKAGYGEGGVVELYLAQIAEESGRYQEAIDRYLLVPDGERAWLAKLRVAAMMAKLNRVPEARRYLADLPAVTIDQRVQVRQAEAALLRDANDNAAAYAVLQQGLVEHPDNPDLLYDAAMVAEKLDKVDEAETILRKVVELKPDDAQALNALGYTLVDRTPKTSEGFALIEKAYKLAPEDPFILDSMGWAFYRLGKLDDAETYLQRAMTQRPDAEIAAHLGEVLWKKGDPVRANEVWQSQLQNSPQNEVLLETVRRYSK